MERTPAERAFRAWRRYVDSIPHAVTRYRYGPTHPSEAAVEKYRIGLERYSRILEREASAYTPGKR